MVKVALGLMVISYTLASLVSVKALGVPEGMIIDVKRSGIAPPDQFPVLYQLLLDAPVQVRDAPGPLIVIEFDVYMVVKHPPKFGVS